MADIVNDLTFDGLEFLRENGAKRAGEYGDQPSFFGTPSETEPSNADDALSTPHCDRGYEIPEGSWKRISVREAPQFAWTDPLMPLRFVDGKDVGRVVAYVASPGGFPVPIRLSQIGAIALRAVPPAHNDLNNGITLRVEVRHIDKVVSLMADLFPWDEIERFAAGLRARGFRLLISRRIGQDDDPRNFTWLQENVRYRSREEMFRLERRAASAYHRKGDPSLVTITDGRLDDKEEIVRGEAPLIGIVKSHASTSYLHPEGWDVLYALRPAERTPALALTTEKLELVTWYVRLADSAGGPLDGVVRVEMSQAFFESTVSGEVAYMDRLSRALCMWRTHDSGYGRAKVTLHPIQQAEDRLGAHFIPTDTLVSRFYKLSGL